MIITFNDIAMPIDVQIKTYSSSVLPPIERQTVKIHGRAGLFTLSKDIGERIISVEFQLLNTTETNYRTKVRELAAWLFYDEPKKFKIDTDPNYYYMAMVDGESVLEEQTNEIGVVSVDFICSQPFAFKDGAVEQTLTLNAEKPIANVGSVDSSPELKINFTGNSTYVEIENKTIGKSLVLGSAVRYGEVSTFDMNTLIFSDAMSSLATWTQLANGTQFNPSVASDGVDSADFVLRTTTVAGSTQQGFGVANTGYGTGTNQWIGASAERVLTTALQDFSVEFDLQMQNTSPLAVNKMEMYLFGNDGSEIAKINFTDNGDGQISPQFWVRLNDPTPYTAPSNNYVGYTGKSGGALVQKYRDNKYYHNPNGFIRVKIARRLNNWRVWIGVLDPNNGMFNKVLRQDLFEFEDSQGVLNYQFLKKIKIVSAAFSGASVKPTEQIFHGVRVYQENIRQYDPTTKRPFIFRSGDELRIDMSKAQIWLNGEEFYQYFDPTSSFWKLQKGNNQIVLYAPTSTATGTIIVNERYI